MFNFRKKIKEFFVLGLVFSSLFSEVVYGWEPNGRFVSGPYDIHLEGRPNSIYPALPNYNISLTQSGEGPDYPVEMSRHHIIPFNTLRSFYNNIINRGDAIWLDSFFRTLAQRTSIYYNDASRDCGVWENDIIDIENLIFGIRYRLIRQVSNNQSPPGLDNFQSFYTWLPGNLFIGPRNRSDDPRDSFERNAYMIVGQNRADNLRVIYDLMTDYNRGINIDFRDLSSRLARVASIRQPFALRASDWARNPITGQYFINTHPDPLKEMNNKNVKLTTKIKDETCDELSKVYNTLERKLVLII